MIEEQLVVGDKPKESGMAELESELRRNGYLILRECFRGDELLRAKAEVLADPHLVWRRKFANGKLSVAETANVWAKTSELRAMISKSPAMEIVQRIVGAEVFLFRDAFISKEPNPSSRFPLHQDSEFWDIQPEELISFWIPFQDSNEKNGVLRVVKGSHLERHEHRVMISDRAALPRFVNKLLRGGAVNSSMGEKGSRLARFSAFLARVINEELLPFLSKRLRFVEKFGEMFVVTDADTHWKNTEVPELQLGDCVIYHSKTIHGSGGNLSERPRVAYVPTFMGARYTRHGTPVSDPRLGYERVV
jgi:ectoine hydroxylase-related dioxygenase (phytanoyl-CoA dioxygenase family)